MHLSFQALSSWLCLVVAPSPSLSSRFRQKETFSPSTGGEKDRPYNACITCLPQVVSRSYPWNSSQWRCVGRSLKSCSYCGPRYPRQSSLEKGSGLKKKYQLFLKILLFKVPHYLAGQYLGAFIASFVVFLVYWDALVWLDSSWLGAVIDKFTH